MKTVIKGLRAPGLFVEHPLGQVPDTTSVTHKCPKCAVTFTGKARLVLANYREHVLDAHMDLLDDECGCCGGFHFPEFDGDCREDWERF